MLRVSITHMLSFVINKKFFAVNYRDHNDSEDHLEVIDNIE